MGAPLHDQIRTLERAATPVEELAAADAAHPESVSSEDSANLRRRRVCPVELRGPGEQEARTALEAHRAELRRWYEIGRRDPFAGTRGLLDYVQQRFGTRVYWMSATRDYDYGGSASWRTNEITIPLVQDEAAAAVVCHELGHLLQPNCSNRGAHQRDKDEDSSWLCLECERDAWVRGMALMPFTAAMQQRARWSLETYRGYAAATPVALTAADAFIAMLPPAPRPGHAPKGGTTMTHERATVDVVHERTVAAMNEFRSAIARGAKCAACRTNTATTMRGTVLFCARCRPTSRTPNSERLDPKRIEFLRRLHRQRLAS